MKYNSIMLSGLPVSGKSTLAKKLSEIYTWPIHSIGQLWREEWKRLYPNAEVSFEEYWRNTSLKDNKEINVKAKKVFEKGHVIGDTRYSVYCKDLPSLLVFVTADLDVRAERGLNTDRYKGKTTDEVRRTLITREQDELTMGYYIFGIDYRSPEHYDIVINSGKLTVEQEVSIITNLVPWLGEF